METIRTSGDALLTIINDILDFSKTEAGLMELEEQPFLLRHCIEDVLDLMAHQVHKKSLELVAVVDPKLPRSIFGDVTRLRQILLNLVGNAIKFTVTGEFVVEVVPSAHVAPGKMGIEFSVRDSGIGIPADRMGRLFQSFSQVDASTNRKIGFGSKRPDVYVNEVLERLDWRTTERLAHTLEGTSGMFGAIKLSRQFAKIEDAAENQRPDELPRLLSEAITEHARISDMLVAKC